MLSRAAGISEEKLAAVMADPFPDGVYEPHEAAVVAFARASTLMQPIDDRMWSALDEHFDNEQKLEIIMTVGLDQMVSRFHAAVHTEVDDWILDQVPEQSCPVRLPQRPPS